MSFWIGSEARSDGTLSGCSGCTWISNQVSKVSNIIPVFYAYIIGFYGHANGLPDGNQAPNGPNLTTGGANLIRNNRAKIISMYSSYAQQAHAVWGTKPLVWLLEGDFVQYTASTQTNPLSYGELAQLAEDITCAIKAAMPNAVVAINHSTWNANDVTQNFWAAMSGVNYDMAWTSGAGNANDFFTPGTTASSYNGTTATYAYLHKHHRADHSRRYQLRRVGDQRLLVGQRRGQSERAHRRRRGRDQRDHANVELRQQHRGRGRRVDDLPLSRAG